MSRPQIDRQSMSILLHALDSVLRRSMGAGAGALLKQVGVQTHALLRFEECRCTDLREAAELVMDQLVRSGWLPRLEIQGVDDDEVRFYGENDPSSGLLGDREASSDSVLHFINLGILEEAIRHTTGRRGRAQLSRESSNPLKITIRLQLFGDREERAT